MRGAVLTVARAAKVQAATAVAAVAVWRVKAAAARAVALTAAGGEAEAPREAAAEGWAKTRPRSSWSSCI